MFYFCLKIFFSFFFFRRLLWPISCSRGCCLVSIYLRIFLLSYCYWLLVSFHCSQKKKSWCDFNLFIFVKKIILWPNMWFVLENVLCVFGKNLYLVQLDGMFCTCLIDPFGLQCCSCPIFPCWSVWMFCPFFKVEQWNLLFVFLFSPAVLFALYIWAYIYCSGVGYFPCGYSGAYRKHLIVTRVYFKLITAPIPYKSSTFLSPTHSMFLMSQTKSFYIVYPLTYLYSYIYTFVFELLYQN